jgi:hypothetical protein
VLQWILTILSILGGLQSVELNENEVGPGISDKVELNEMYPSLLLGLAASSGFDDFNQILRTEFTLVEELKELIMPSGRKKILASTIFSSKTRLPSPIAA